MSKRKVVLVTIAIWAVASAAAVYFPSAVVMNGPHDDPEQYIYSWSFQLLGRLLVHGPVFVAVLFVILFIEWFTYELRKHRAAN